LCDYGRVTVAGKIDSVHDNWWELRQPGSNSSPDPLQAPKGVADSVPQIFLSSTQRAAGDREWAALAGRAGVATNFLCAETLAWAKSHPGDPRLRERWVMRRTAVVNQICGLFLERGITVRNGRRHLEAALPEILEDAAWKLSAALRLLLKQLNLELEQLATRLGEAESLIQLTARNSEACRRLDAIPGIGPLTATALNAAIGNGAAFRKGREFAAWLGLVPREHSTGGRQKLLGISKRGNAYLWKLFVQCARAVLQQRSKQSADLSTWLGHLTVRAHRNVVCVALANKLARIAWAVLATGQAYRSPAPAAVAAA